MQLVIGKTYFQRGHHNVANGDGYAVRIVGVEEVNASSFVGHSPVYLGHVVGTRLGQLKAPRTPNWRYQPDGSQQNKEMAAIILGHDYASMSDLVVEVEDSQVKEYSDAQ